MAKKETCAVCDKSRRCSEKCAQKYCCHQNSQYYCGRSKAEYSGEKWRGCGNPYIHTGKSDSLSPPDKSPLDKCGQAAEEPASAVMGCSAAIRMKLCRAKWGSKARGPQAEKLSQQQRSFQLLLAKPLKKFTHRHSPYSANIGYSMHTSMCLKCNCACVRGKTEHICTYVLQLLVERGNSSIDEKKEESRKKRENLFLMFFRHRPLENTP